MFVLLLAQAHAFETLHNASGSQLKWTQMPIRFDINPSNSQGLDEDMVWANTYRAADVWAQVEGADIEWDVGDTLVAEAGHDGQAVVFFNDQWSGDESLLALTSSWSTGEGEIISFDIAVNSAHHSWAMDGGEGQVDLQNTLAHEFGHVLGFGHETEIHEATMWSSSGVGETAKRDLHPVDIAGAQALYPELEPEQGPELSLPLACSATGRGGLGGLLPALLILVAARRRQPSTTS
jgi:hypothetical protein